MARQIERLPVPFRKSGKSPAWATLHLLHHHHGWQDRQSRFNSHAMSPATTEAQETPALTLQDEGAAYQIERGKPLPVYNHSRTQARFIKQIPETGPFAKKLPGNLQELNGFTAPIHTGRMGARGYGSEF